MGFLDKAKATATQAMQQGQAKVGAMQQSRQESELYKALGEVVYKAQRQGGDQAAVDAALTALDDHFTQVEQAAAAAPPAPGGAGSSTTPASSPAATQEGNFTLDDM